MFSLHVNGPDGRAPGIPGSTPPFPSAVWFPRKRRITASLLPSICVCDEVISAQMGQETNVRRQDTTKDKNKEGMPTPHRHAVDDTSPGAARSRGGTKWAMRTHLHRHRRVQTSLARGRRRVSRVQTCPPAWWAFLPTLLLRRRKGIPTARTTANNKSAGDSVTPPSTKREPYSPRTV